MRKALIAKRGQIQNCLETLTHQRPITEFDEALWYGMVGQVQVTPAGELRFIFKGGA